MNFLRKHNLSVFLRMCVKNTRIKADFRQALTCRLAKPKSSYSLVIVVVALPQGAKTFRLIRYPSPLGGSVHRLHRPPIFTFHTEKTTQAFGPACQC